jgi:hypothetical protein
LRKHFFIDFPFTKQSVYLTFIDLKIGSIYNLLRMTGSTIINSRGVRTRSQGYIHGTWRGTEEQCLKHIANTENNIANTLCESHVLPEGAVCDSRVERKGIYFCPQGKEGCPLKG